jgi:hypothetical protein
MIIFCSMQRFCASISPNRNFVDTERIGHGSPLRLPDHPVNGHPMHLEGWSGMQTKVLHIWALNDFFLVSVWLLLFASIGLS